MIRNDRIVLERHAGERTRESGHSAASLTKGVVGGLGLALLQDDGFVKICDRLKDMILVSGFNVYPNEIESVVSAHPDVIECAAIGVPDEKSGEAVKLYVKARPGLDAEQLRAFCREQLTAYKVPRFIEFRAELPKSNVGKILRRELRA